MDKIIVTIVGVILIGFVAWFFFGGKSVEDMSKMSEEDMKNMHH